MILGFFDSGLGGKVVMEDFRRRFPEIPMILEMDREHCPFGDLSHDEICEYTRIGVQKLFDRGADIVILACNTASVHALRLLQQEIFPDRYILGVMIPGAEKIVEKGYKKVGVLATEATVRTRAYKERVKILDDSIIVEEVGAPGLVPLIEMGITSGEKIEKLLDGYLKQFSPDIEAIVLACTHFPIVKMSIQKIWKKLHSREISLIDPGKESAEKFAIWMERHGMKIGEIHHFEEYLHALADHEDMKNREKLNPRERILVNAGIRLNWMGDFLANPAITYEKSEIPVNEILFTGTDPEWNTILIEQCERSPEKFQTYIQNDETIRKKFTEEASFGDEVILVRGPYEKGKYRVIDGMHRFVGAVIEKRETITAYVPINEHEHLPICEAHVVYDIIRGFQRHARDEQGKIELYYALKLLARTYENVRELLKTRFCFSYIADDEVQAIIRKVLEEIEIQRDTNTRMNVKAKILPKK